MIESVKDLYTTNEKIVLSQWNFNKKIYIEKKQNLKNMEYYIVVGEGIDFIDPFFHKNLEKINELQKKEPDIKLGFAFVLSAESENTAKTYAYSFFRLIQNYECQLPYKVICRDCSNEISQSFVDAFEEYCKGKKILKKPDHKVEYVKYKIKSGDNIINIANKFHVMVSDILWVNKDLNPEKLITNKKIKVSIDSDRKISEKYKLLQIKSGDNIEDICNKYQISYKELEWINLFPNDINICSGQILKIPKVR